MAESRPVRSHAETAKWPRKVGSALPPKTCHFRCLFDFLIVQGRKGVGGRVRPWTWRSFWVPMSVQRTRHLEQQELWRWVICWWCFAMGLFVGWLVNKCDCMTIPWKSYLGLTRLRLGLAGPIRWRRERPCMSVTDLLRRFVSQSELFCKEGLVIIRAPTQKKFCYQSEHLPRERIKALS